MTPKILIKYGRYEETKYTKKSPQLLVNLKPTINLFLIILSRLIIGAFFNVSLRGVCNNDVAIPCISTQMTGIASSADANRPPRNDTYLIINQSTNLCPQISLAEI